MAALHLPRRRALNPDENMHVRAARPTDLDVLLDIWLRSVRATHTFLSEEDIQFYLPLVREALEAGHFEVSVLCSDTGAPMGFMGLNGSKVEAMFLAPEHRGRGGGRRLLDHARALCGELTLDVNEQNEAARRFYEACGFVVEGRSERDGTGRPFPLLHMRRRAVGAASPARGRRKGGGGGRS